MTMRTLLTIEDDWIIESGPRHDGSNKMYHYLLHKHWDTRPGLTVPSPTEYERICVGCKTRVPLHLAGFLILCRWEARDVGSNTG